MTEILVRFDDDRELVIDMIDGDLAGVLDMVEGAVSNVLAGHSALYEAGGVMVMK